MYLRVLFGKRTNQNFGKKANSDRPRIKFIFSLAPPPNGWISADVGSCTCTITDDFADTKKSKDSLRPASIFGIKISTLRLARTPRDAAPPPCLSVCMKLTTAKVLTLNIGDAP